ncbi:MAG: hypothetical protein ACI4EK_05010 [Wujia sp.]
MLQHEKQFVIRTMIMTIPIMLAMALIAICIPKQYFTWILVLEITLAIVWTIGMIINVIATVKKIRQRENNDKDS